MQNKRKRSKDCAPSDDIQQLIQLVRQNPALYNYKLQPNQRRRVDVLNGWARIAAEIGNKYTVEECRRKWKNLRDTYHQYRLRKPKLTDGLSKWRYSKDLEFLSNVYQPKLESRRTSQPQGYLLEDVVVHENTTQHHYHSEDSKGLEQHHHGGITLVSDDAETFILAYGEDVNDELDHSEIVKNEPSGGYVDHLDEDGGVTAEVDYEEVCLYEEAGNAPGANCETIVAGGGGVDTSSCSPTDSKTFQYIDNDFCIESSINAHDHQLPSPAAVSVVSSGGSNNKLKSMAIMTNAGALSGTNDTSSAVTVFTTTAAAAGAALMDNGTATTVHEQPILPSAESPTPSVSTREELDLFFDFLKRKIQRFSKEEITGIQVEFLNCVLRREGESAQKAANCAAASQFSFVCKK